jgi:hypothetical protein
MSVLLLNQTITALIPGLTSSFLASGGTPAYVYSVRANGAGGTINSSTGIYTAPAVGKSNPINLYDVVQVKDSLGAIATAQILVGTPLLLFCEILQNQLSLPQGRVFLWDQKIMQPTDSGLYIAVSVPICRPFGNTYVPDGSGSGLNAVQSVNMMATLEIDAISRGTDARDRKEEIIMALYSVYSQQQQEINSFSIGRLPAGSRFLNLSQIDGAAIPYRYKISVNMQYSVTKTLAVPYFGTFQGPTVSTNP